LYARAYVRICTLRPWNRLVFPTLHFDLLLEIFWPIMIITFRKWFILKSIYYFPYLCSNLSSFCVLFLQEVGFLAPWHDYSKSLTQVFIFDGYIGTRGWRQCSWNMWTNYNSKRLVFFVNLVVNNLNTQCHVLLSRLKSDSFFVDWFVVCFVVCCPIDGTVPV